MDPVTSLTEIGLVFAPSLRRTVDRKEMKQWIKMQIVVSCVCVLRFLVLRKSGRRQEDHEEGTAVFSAMLPAMMRIHTTFR